MHFYCSIMQIIFHDCVIIQYITFIFYSFILLTTKYAHCKRFPLISKKALFELCKEKLHGLKFSPKRKFYRKDFFSVHLRNSH